MVKYNNQINGGLVMFLGKTILNKLALMWAIWKKSVQKKGDNKFDVQNVTIAFMLFKYHRSIDNSIYFYLFILSWKGSW